MNLTSVDLRTPEEVAAPRIGVLARLPVFLALEGRRALLAGGSPAAAWKAELLLAAGANLDIYAPEPSEELLAISRETWRGTVTVYRREWRPQDCVGAAIAVGAFDDDAEAERFATAARAVGVPVNVIDKPRFCDFNFGAIVNRSPLVIGISTDGASPIFGQAIRAILVKNLGPGDATNVKINDPLPAGVKLVSIVPDTTYHMTCNVETPAAPIVLDGPVVCVVPLLPELTVSKVVITVQVTRIGSLTNTASAGSDDTNPTTGTATGTTTVLVVAPSLSIVKTTNGTDGPLLWVGDPVTWKYHVVNTGNVALTNVRVTDDKVPASSISCNGGTNVVASLSPGAAVDCVAIGSAILGSYRNVGTATGTPPVGGNVSGSDPSNYTGFSTGQLAPTATTCDQFVR
jgi:siroheme synthase-like protein